MGPRYGQVLGYQRGHDTLLSMGGVGHTSELFVSGIWTVLSQPRPEADQSVFGGT